MTSVVSAVVAMIISLNHLWIFIVTFYQSGHMGFNVQLRVTAAICCTHRIEGVIIYDSTQNSYTKPEVRHFIIIRYWGAINTLPCEAMTMFAKFTFIIIGH